MTKNLELFATVTGAMGILLALVAGLGRLTGFHYVLGIESISMMVGAIALMAMSCVVQLHLIRTRPQSPPFS